MNDAVLEPDRINGEALSEMLHQLRLARFERDTGMWKERPNPELEYVTSAVAAIQGFISAHPKFRQERLDEPFVQLIHAFVEIGEGRKPMLLTPVRNNGRPTKKTAETNLMGIAAKAVDELLATGNRTLPECVRLVSGAIQASDIPGGKKINEGTVSGWRERLMAGDGAAPPKALLRYRAPLPPEAGETPGKRASYLIHAIRHAPSLRWS